MFVKLPKSAFLMSAFLALTGPARVVALSAPPVLHLEGTLTTVNVPRSRATLVTSNGSQYLLDIDQTDIALPGRSGGGRISDLSQGMRVRVDGEQEGNGHVETVILRVIGLGSSKAIRATPAIPAAPLQPPAAVQLPPPVDISPVDLRGIVVSVDSDGGRFGVLIHNRVHTIVVGDRTQIYLQTVQTPGSYDANVLPFKPGDIVTVNGMLRTDGTVKADHIRQDASSKGIKDFVGRVVPSNSADSDRQFRIRLSNNRVVTVHVPHDVPLLSHGQTVSLDSLAPNQTVHVQGYSQNSHSVQATRVQVLDTQSGSF